MKADCQHQYLSPGPYSEGGYRGWTPPPRKVCTKISGSTFLLKRWACVASECYYNTVVLKCAPECIKMQHFEGEYTPQTPFLHTGLVLCLLF